VLGLTSPLLWYTTRATGIMALLLLTTSVVIGVLTSARGQTTRWPRFAVSELHRRVSLLAVVFVGVHVVTTAVDSFVPIGWLPVVVPFVSGYEPLWVGIGAVAFDLLVAVTVTSLVRRHLRPTWWRAVHWLSYLCWPVAVAHAIGVGTDAGLGWVLGLIVVCCLAVLGALAWRMLTRPLRVGPGSGTAAASPQSTALARRAQLESVRTPDRIP
jgi:methionine sulfoxide reductase heme-binding subunit